MISCTLPESVPKLSRMSLSLTLYTKMDCELCEPFKQIVQSVANLKILQNEIALTLIDIDADPIAYERYHNKIPALEINGILAFKYKIDKFSLLKKIQNP